MPVPVKRSVTVAGHRTSLSLEREFWDALKEIASGSGMSMQRLIEEIDTNRNDEGLSTAARLYILKHFRERSRRD